MLATFVFLTPLDGTDYASLVKDREKNFLIFKINYIRILVFAKILNSLT
jgi:hypothetical protein